MPVSDELQAQQIANWNGDSGRYWVAQQDQMDAALLPVGLAAITQAAPKPGEHVLDIGCGCGATGLLLADAVGAGGHVTGLDVSAPMLDRARQRSAGVTQLDWVLADAARHVFRPGSFDLLFSRFGVMFFGDPVAAFANLRQSLKPGGRIVFACWRALTENSWMNLPYQAALAHVPPPRRSAADDPGPFAFADQARVARILTDAGFPPMQLAGGEGLDGATRRATETGVAKQALQDQPEALRTAAIASIRATLEPYVQGRNVELPGAVWLVCSQLPAA